MSKKLLTGGLHSSNFQLFIQKQYPEIDCIISKSAEETMQLIHEVDVIAGFNFIPKTDLSHIKWIHSFGAGIDSFLQHKLAPDLLMTKTTGGMGRRIAQYCLTYILNHLQEVQLFQQQQQQKLWKQKFLPELKDLNIYIFGTGFVGEAIAQLLAPLTNKVVGFNTSGSSRNHFSTCIALEQYDSIEFDEHAIIINALPLTKETANIMDSRLFQMMKDVLLINIGRGGTINPNDLIKSLENQQIRQAVLDVFVKEPLPQDDLFWHHPQVMVTPHISGITNLSDIQSSFSLVYDAMKKGEEIPNQINMKNQY